MITKSKLLFYSCLSFVLGIFISGLIDEKFFRFNFYIFIFVNLFLVLSFVFYKKNIKNNFKIWHFFLFLIFFTLAFWRYGLSIHSDKIKFVVVGYNYRVVLCLIVSSS